MSLSPNSILLPNWLNVKNRLFILARQGKRLPTWYIAILVTIMIVVGIPNLVEIFLDVLQIRNLTSSLIKSTDVRISALGFSIPIIIIYSARILVVALWVKIIEKRPFWTV